MKIRLLKILFFLLYLPQLSAQQFTSAAFPNEDGLIELWVPDLCGATLQWQESQQETDDWQDVPGATSNTRLMEATSDALGEKQFRVRATMPPATEPEYSYAFSVQVIDSLEELAIGQFYDGVFVYANRPDTILGAIFTDIRAVYGCAGEEIPDAGSFEIGAGIQNTNSLRNNCPDPGSIGVVFSTLSLLGHEDWFLPAYFGLRAIADRFVENGITQFTQTSEEVLFLSSSQRRNRPEEFVWGLRNNSGLSGTSIKKDVEGQVIAARRLTHNDERSYRAQTLWSSYQFPELLTLENNPEGSDSVTVEYLGVDLPGNEYVLGTSGSMRYQSGEGPGPYLLANNFGGYQRFELQVVNAGCHTLSFRTPVFKIDQSQDIGAPFPETHRGEMAWADYDNDGRKDVLITGTDTTALYRNLGDDQFAWQPTPFPALTFSFADWGDTNNDGRPDLALVGLGPDDLPYTGVFLNAGDGDFQEIPHSLPGVFNGFAEWIDHNMDGQLELLLSGETESGEPFTGLFQTGPEGFTELPTTLPDLKNSSVSVADYNRDNYPDLILMGNDGTERTTRILRNELGTFVVLPDSIIGLEHGAASWTDFNNDGLLDFAVAGNKDTLIYQIGPGAISVSAGRAGWLTLFQNLGNDVFTEVGNTSNSGNDLFNAYLNPIFSFADIEAADYDNDGDDDLILSGIPAIGWVSSGSGEGVERLTYRSITQIMRNDNETGYVGIEPDLPANWSLPFYNHDIPLNFECSTIGFVDTDGDDQLDIFRGGRSYGPAAVYRWSNAVTNERPGLPVELAVTTGCDSVLLNWNVATDDYTLQSALTYDIYLQHQDSMAFVFSPANDEALRSNQLSVQDLSPGTYRWGLRTTDRAKARSGFQEGPAFTIDIPPVPEVTSVADTLFSSAPSGNQWYNEAGLIPGATESTYTISASGTYYNIVTVDGCSSLPSAAIALFLTSIDEVSETQILEVWPSPAGDFIQLRSEASLLDTTYHIYSMGGKRVMSGNLVGSQQLRISSLSPGTYLITIETTEGIISQRFIKGT